MTPMEAPRDRGDYNYQPLDAEDATGVDEDAARAVGGEGAVELEATAPSEIKRVVLPPVSDAERDALRKEADPIPRRARTSGLIQGPNGQLVSGGRKGRGKGSWDQH